MQLSKVLKWLVLTSRSFCESVGLHTREWAHILGPKSVAIKKIKK